MPLNRRKRADALRGEDGEASSIDGEGIRSGYAADEEERRGVVDCLDDEDGDSGGNTRSRGGA